MEEEGAKPPLEPSDKTRADEGRKPPGSSNDKQTASTPGTPPQGWPSHVQAFYAAGAPPNLSFSSTPPMYPQCYHGFWRNLEHLQQPYGIAAFQYNGFYHPGGFHSFPAGVTPTPWRGKENSMKENQVEIMEKRRRFNNAEISHDLSGKSETKASSVRINTDDVELSTAKENQSPSQEKDICNNNVAATTDNLVDEDEKKRERRKQSNRESAKRSRIRKQQELELLRAQRKQLGEECSEIKYNILSLSEKCETLSEENNCILEELEQLYGPESVSNYRAILDELVNGGSSDNHSPNSIGLKSSIQNQNEDSQS